MWPSSICSIVSRPSIFAYSNNSLNKVLKFRYVINSGLCIVYSSVLSMMFYLLSIYLLLKGYTHGSLN